MTLSKTAQMQAERAVRALIAEGERDGFRHLTATERDEWLADASYDEANARNITTIETFDSDRRSSLAYDRWMEWRVMVEQGVLAHFTEAQA
jgi:hypothetical protein